MISRYISLDDKYYKTDYLTHVDNICLFSVLKNDEEKVHRSVHRLAFLLSQQMYMKKCSNQNVKLHVLM